MPFLRKYGVAITTGTAYAIAIPIIKRGVVDYAVSADWSPAGGDVKVSLDGGAAASITALPTARTMGNTAVWEFIFTAAELQARQILVTVSDAATKAVEDTAFIIETYGNASAMYAWDMSLGNLPANVTQLLGTAWLTPGTAGTPDVNAKLVGGTPQTGRDLGASVLLSVGVGTGQVNLSSGKVPATLAATDVTGNVAADVQTIKTQAVTCAAGVTVLASVGTASASTAQTGDAYAYAVSSITPGINELILSTVANTGRTVVDTAATTTSFKTNLPEVDGFWNDCLLVFTSGALAGQARPIVSYTQANGVITVDEPFTSAPANGASFQINVSHVHPESQIASAIWKDTTASDFTAAGSIGKSVMNGVALGTGLTINGYTGNTPQTGDAYAYLGTNLGALGANATALVTAVWSTAVPGSFTAGEAGYVLGNIATGTPPTATAIATAVWQDATAGDFTVVGSIGKSLFTSGNAPGAASGLAIVGSNMGTVSGISGVTFPTNFGVLSISATTGLVDITQAAADKVWSTAARALTDKAGFTISGTITTLDALATHGDSTWATATGFATAAVWTGTLATNLGTLASHDPGATLGTSTLTQTQVTGGAYALNSASFAFNAALDFTTAQKAATLAHVTLVDTTTTNTDMRGTNGAAVAGDAMTLTSAYDFAKGTVAMTESYAANGIAPTPVQALYAIQQYLMGFGIVGVNYTVTKLDGVSTAFVVTLNDATTPTAATRS